MKTKTSKRKNYWTLGIGLLLIVSALVYGYSYLPKSLSSQVASYVTIDADLVISKNEVKREATFYPIKVGNVEMEVMALKADDGTIRTAFNTCQICFNSGRGYYTQDGEKLICQNCGNRFGLNDVEVVRGGCNPVPIMTPNKTENSEQIVIKKEFLDQNKELFKTWKI